MRSDRVALLAISGGSAVSFFEISVCNRIFMPFWAMGFKSMLSWERIAPQYVHPGCDLFQMIRVHTKGISTQVINLKALLKGTFMDEVRKAVGINCSSFRRLHAVYPICYWGKFSISNCFSAKPYPTILGFLNLLQKKMSVPVCDGLIHSRLIARGSRCSKM